MSRGTRLGGLLLAVLVGVWSCDFATDVEVLEIAGTGVLFGQAYLDLNGNGAADAGDDPLANASIVLTTVAGGDVVLEATTDTLGVFVLESVPVGSYNIGLDSSVLSDTLEAIGSSPSVAVELGDTTFFSIGASFPKLSLTEVRTAAPGRRVFTEGVALNARLASTDGTIHLIDTVAVAYLRTTNSSLPTGNVLVGDSVRFLGRTAVNNGQPVLDAVTPIVLLRGLALPPPVETSTATAATANAGALDAAVVRIRLAEISDTSTTPNGDFHFWANDGTDSVEVVFKYFRGIDPTGIRPDTVVRINRASGLLTPFDDGSGTVRWRLLPRAASEVVPETKSADLAVTTAFDTPTATANDTVQITLVARNLATSTHTATSVSVTDTIPAALTFLSATATSGSYSAGTRVWDVGNLAPGAADTLRIDAQVTGGPGVATNTARLNPLVLEVQTNAANDQASANLTIS